MKKIVLMLILVILTGCSSTISFDANGGSEIESMSVKKDEIVDLPIPTLEGHTFKGWYLDEELSDKLTESIFDTSIDLYAKWIVNKYSFAVHFNDEILVDKEYNYSESIDVLKNLELEGYSFGGWYLDSNYVAEFNITKMPANNLNIYAKMIPNIHKITFVTNGGLEIESIDFPYNGDLNATRKSSRMDDATFKGWFLDSKFTIPVDNQTMPDNDIVLYAKWKTFQIVQTNIAKAKQILLNYGCAIDRNNPQRCMELSVNGLSVDAEILLNRWNTKTTVFSIGHMYIGHAVWYSYEGDKLTKRYTINNKTAPEKEVQDVIDRIPAALILIEKIENSFTNAGLLSMDDLEWE